MSTRRMMMSLTSMAFLVLIGGAASAQASPTLIARVPFDFVAGDMQFPAGSYVVSMVEGASGVALIRRADGRQGMFLMTLPAGADAAGAESANPEVVFTRYENEYALVSLIFGDAQSRDLVLAPSRGGPKVAEVPVVVPAHRS